MRQEEHPQQELAERFYRKALELARQGVFGRSLKTQVTSLREAYIHWVSLLDQAALPILIYGEKGSGKRRHVEEYFYLHNLLESLKGSQVGKLRVFRGDFVGEGFSQLLSSPHTAPGDVLYLEYVDRLSKSCQAELLNFLSVRQELLSQGIPQARLIVGTEKALSMLVLQGDFLKELFQVLTSYAIFLPNLQERSADFPILLGEVLKELCGSSNLPPVDFVNVLSQRSFYENFDELKKLLKSMLAKKPDVKTWSYYDLVQPNRGRHAATRFMLGDPVDASSEVEEKRNLKVCLRKHGGNLSRVAQELSIDKSELMRKILAYGLRQDIALTSF